MVDTVVDVVAGIVLGVLLTVGLYRHLRRSLVRERVERETVQAAAMRVSRAEAALSEMGASLSCAPVALSPADYQQSIRTLLRGCAEIPNVCPAPVPFRSAAGLTYEHLPPRARFVAHVVFLQEFARRKQLEGDPAKVAWNTASVALFQIVMQAAAFAATMTALVYEDETLSPAAFRTGEKER